eukprot:scaffold10787_cov123-Isochrysis_galbana.AAC.8
MDYMFVVKVKVFRREESIGVGIADSLPIELNVGGKMTKSDRPFLNTRGWLAVSHRNKVGEFFDGELVEGCVSSVEGKLLSDGEATSFGFDVIGAPFGGKFTLIGREGCKGCD